MGYKGWKEEIIRVLAYTRTGSRRVLFQRCPEGGGNKKRGLWKNPRVFSCKGVLIYRRASDPATLVSTGIHVLHSFGALVVLRLTNRNPNQHSCQRRRCH